MHIPAIRGLLFDLDGVLCDTAKYHYLAWKRLANELGFDFTEEQNEELKGISRIDSLTYLLKLGEKKLTVDQFEDFLVLKNTWYLELIKEMTPNHLLPGVLHFLESSKNEGIKIGLGSSSKNAPLILKTLNITGFFDCIVDGNSVTKSKPNPEIFLFGASQLNLQPSECVVFEDATSGVDAALAGGFLCVGIGNQKTLNKATFVYSGFKELDFNTFVKSLSKYERSL